VYRELIEEVVRSANEDSLKLGISPDVLEEIKNSWVNKLCEYTDIGEYKIKNNYGRIEDYYNTFNRAYDGKSSAFKEYNYSYYEKKNKKRDRDADSEDGHLEMDEEEYDQYDGIGKGARGEPAEVCGREAPAACAGEGAESASGCDAGPASECSGRSARRLEIRMSGGRIEIMEIGAGKPGTGSLLNEDENVGEKEEIEGVEKACTQIDGMGENFNEEELDSNEFSESDCEVDGEEPTKNVMLCLFDKVTRVKDKRRCVLKHGFLSIGRTDYTFNIANGDLEW